MQGRRDGGEERELDSWEPGGSEDLCDDTCKYRASPPPLLPLSDADGGDEYSPCGSSGADAASQVAELAEQPKRPCPHNQWIKYGKKQKKIILRCANESCRALWRIVPGVTPKCKDFYGAGCPLGSDCPRPHIYCRQGYLRTSTVPRDGLCRRSDWPVGSAGSPPPPRDSSGTKKDRRSPAADQPEAASDAPSPRAAAPSPTAAAPTPTAAAPSPTAAAPIPKSAPPSPTPHSPIANSPTAHSPTFRHPAAHSPTFHSSAFYSPATNSPVAHSPVAHSPVANCPVANSPVPYAHSPTPAALALDQAIGEGGLPLPPLLPFPYEPTDHSLPLASELSSEPLPVAAPLLGDGGLHPPLPAAAPLRELLAQQQQQQHLLPRELFTNELQALSQHAYRIEPCRERRARQRKRDGPRRRTQDPAGAHPAVHA
eukprot:TRINITY_DN1998_c0_g1_i2.p1 TRINITY_DN1998_c0_g1~~TRINITY_DN1998_c0_g1_i2.p1  ORF type:complete len:457 (+),score=110.97 TRINITY_DN1998_c0_g1_i2:92-1372(+)